MWNLLLFGLAVSSTALAVPPLERPQTPPAAPEPSLLLMATVGLALGGCYIMWRRKQAQQTPAT